jgi:hypothetical protein
MHPSVKQANRFDASDGVACAERTGRDRLQRCAAVFEPQVR